ncbi:MAG: hypothetical protein WAU45_04100 [Blastocatellia bacterium]
MRISSARRKGLAVGGVSINTYACGPDASRLSSNPEGLRVASNATGPSADEVEPARARLHQADQEMDSLKSRIDYLEARAASSVGATQRELEELMQVRDALGAGAADIGGLYKRLEQLTQERGALPEWDGWDDY